MKYIWVHVKHHKLFSCKPKRIETYKANPDKYLIINEEWYTPAPTKPNTPKDCLGYGGRLFKFKRHGSDIVEE